jgi:hypothetical protein
LSDQIKWDVVRGAMEEKRIVKEIQDNKNLRAAVLIREAHKFLAVKKVFDAFHNEIWRRKLMLQTIFLVNAVKTKMIRKLRRLKPKIDQRNYILVSNSCASVAGAIMNKLAHK